MKALSVQQPWAWCIIFGGKPIENRTWPTNYRGRVLIHAGQRFRLEDWIWLRENGHTLDERMMTMPTDWHEFKLGGIVGSVDIVGCIDHSASPWFSPGGFGFELANVRPEPFTPLKGRLGFFDVPWPPTPQPEFELML